MIYGMVVLFQSQSIASTKQEIFSHIVDQDFSSMTRITSLIV